MIIIRVDGQAFTIQGTSDEQSVTDLYNSILEQRNKGEVVQLDERWIIKNDRISAIRLREYAE